MAEKITIVRHYNTAVYLGDRLLLDARDVYLPCLLRLLGFEAEEVNVAWEEMPDGGPGGCVTAPASLARLRAHLDRVRAEKRRAHIKSLEATLEGLRQEEEDDRLMGRGM